MELGDAVRGGRGVVCDDTARSGRGALGLRLIMGGAFVRVGSTGLEDELPSTTLPNGAGDLARTFKFAE